MKRGFLNQEKKSEIPQRKAHPFVIMSTVATMRPLTNITVAAEQQTNRRSTPSAQPIDPTMCGQPCYGPSLPTQYQQFYDLSSGYSAQPTESTLQYTPRSPSIRRSSHNTRASCLTTTRLCASKLYAAGLYDPSKVASCGERPSRPSCYRNAHAVHGRAVGAVSVRVLPSSAATNAAVCCHGNSRACR